VTSHLLALAMEALQAGHAGQEVLADARRLLQNSQSGVHEASIAAVESLRERLHRALAQGASRRR